MPKAQNKVKFGLKKVYVAALTVNNTGSSETFTYDTPVALPGAVSLSLTPEGSNDPFYADDIVYYRSRANNGYTGTLEVAKIPDWFRTGFLGETEDSKGVVIEKSTSVGGSPFALLFEFDGDIHQTRHALYYCTASRPSINSQTVENSAVPQTDTIEFAADPRSDGLVKAKTTADVDETVYASWYTSVQEPVFTA